MKLTEDKGRWFNYEDDVEFKLKYCPNAEEYESGFALFNDICVGWKGIKDQKDKEVKFDTAGKVAFLRSEEGQEAFMWMCIKTKDLINFLDLENIKKKLPERFNLSTTTQTPTSQVA